MSLCAGALTSLALTVPQQEKRTRRVMSGRSRTDESQHFGTPQEELPSHERSADADDGQTPTAIATAIAAPTITGTRTYTKKYSSKCGHATGKRSPPRAE